MVNLVADVVYILGESLDTAGDELNKGKFNKRLSQEMSELLYNSKDLLC